MTIREMGMGVLRRTQRTNIRRGVDREEKLKRIATWAERDKKICRRGPERGKCDKEKGEKIVHRKENGTGT